MATSPGVLCCAPRPSPAPMATATSQSLSSSSASPSTSHGATGLATARSRRGWLTAAAAPPQPRCVASPTSANVKDQTKSEVAMGYTMTEICDKFIEFFMYKKPETKDWRKVLVYREEWQRYREHFYKHCQVRIDTEADSSLKEKLVLLARKVKKVDDEIEKHMKLFTELRENPADINAIVARRRKDFTQEFFSHLNFLVNAYNGLDERDGVVRLAAKCLSAIHAYDCTMEQLDIESAQSKFDDILNSSSLDDACDKIKSLAKAKELDSSLVLLINRAWAAAQDSTTMKDKVKDIMYHIYTTTKESLKSISPPEMKLLKYLLNIEDPEERFGALATAFSPGDEREVKDEDALYTMSYALLKDVTPQSQQWTIRARVIRFSEYLSTDQPPKVLRLDFVALDEEGTAMDGQIPTACLLKFTPHFKEESLYSITSFHVTNARAIYRPVNHPYLIRFTSYTKLKEIRPVPDGFPKYTHSAIQFHQLQFRIGIHDYCSDIVGVLTGVTHTRMQSTSKGEKPLRNVHVSDGSQEIAIALWGRQAEAFDAESYMEMAARGPVIFLFVGMTCGQYNGKISLHGSSFCRWYADPDIPEAVALRDRYIGQLPLAKWLDTGSGTVTPTRITITELAAFRDPHPIYTNKYIVHIKIKEIKTDQPWCFYACELCNKGMKESSDGNKCTKPNCPGTIGHNRYRVPIIVVDPMPSPHNNEPCSVEMVLFGKLAEELIGMPVDALIACTGEPNGPLPKRMTALYGRQFEVRISVSPISMSLTTIIYQIDRITRMMNVVLPDPKTPHLTQLPEQQKSPQTSSLAISDASTLQNTMQENVGPTSPNDDPTKNNTQDPGPVVTNLLATPPLQNMEPAKEPPVPKDGSLKRSIAAMDDSDPTNAQRTDIPQNSRQVKRRLDLSGPSDEN